MTGRCHSFLTSGKEASAEPRSFWLEAEPPFFPRALKKRVEQAFSKAKGHLTSRILPRLAGSRPQVPGRAGWRWSEPAKNGWLPAALCWKLLDFQRITSWAGAYNGWSPKAARHSRTRKADMGHKRHPSASAVAVYHLRGADPRPFIKFFI